MTKTKKGGRKKTPIRAGLVANSALLPLVQDGLGALAKAHRGYVHEDLRPAFADSVDIDAAFLEGHENEHRWDYLLGHAAHQALYALEPHSAHDKEVSEVIAKRARAREHLRDHLRAGVAVADWFWVASGKVDFTALDKTTLRLEQNGITFVGRQLLAKRLAR